MCAANNDKEINKKLVGISKIALIKSYASFSLPIKNFKRNEMPNSIKGKKTFIGKLSKRANTIIFKCLQIYILFFVFSISYPTTNFPNQ